MNSNRKEQIVSLLKGLETGDESAVKVVNESKYIQHNPQTHEGSEGLAALFKRLSKTSPRVNIVRIFEDGDYVFGHTEYDFANSNIGFEIFRFEDDQAVEHWDNIQRRQEINASGHSMVDGPVDVSDSDLTDDNRELVTSYVSNILINRQLEMLGDYISNDNHYTQHNPHMEDGFLAQHKALEETFSDGYAIQYKCNHRILAEGNFVLTVSEGSYNGSHSSYFDLFRVSEGKLVEHWDTIETIPPREEWKNANGKF
jgi:predicted SnoaL-like aldol condensation-catalyzing enzyme